jgi:hypothetical protein
MGGYNLSTSANQRTNERDARYMWGTEDDETADVVSKGDGPELDMENLTPHPPVKDHPAKK